MVIQLANGILFNISWLAIVMTQSAAIAPAVVLVHLCIHFSLVGISQRELQLIALVSLLGVVVDQALFRAGVFNVLGHAAWPPLWMTCLWPVLATTLMHAFRNFQHRPRVAAVLGAVSGALSYTAGTRLTDVAFFSDVWGPVVLGALWAGLFPFILWLAARTERETNAAYS